jgi:hypothetical protein
VIILIGVRSGARRQATLDKDIHCAEPPGPGKRVRVGSALVGVSGFAVNVRKFGTVTRGRAS